MLRFALVGSLVLVPVAVLSLKPAPQVTSTLCANIEQHEPVVTYDIAGGTLLGPIYLHLAIYNSGHAIISRTTMDPDPGACQTSFLTPAEIQQLRADLIAANVATLCDEQLSVSDVPLTTISYFRGTSNAAVRTFSYWLGFGGPYQGVELVMQNLIATKFPNF